MSYIYIYIINGRRHPQQWQQIMKNKRQTLKRANSKFADACMERKQK